MSSKSRFLVRTLLIILVTLAWIALSASAAIELRADKKLNAEANRADGLAAWQKVYSVLTSPRCINCHTATNYRQQGDDRHRHFANVIRGPANKGVPGLTQRS
jgi:mono/diheme cytochrome c family protein